MKNKTHNVSILVFLLSLTFNVHADIMKVAEGDSYLLSGIAVGAGAAALGMNVPVTTGLGLLVTYIYLNRPGVSDTAVDELLEDTGVEIIEDRQGTSIVLPVDMVFRGPISNPVIDVRYYPILNTVSEILKLCDPVDIKVSGHTDKIMDPTDNFVSSDKYAWSVANYLLGIGVSPKRIIAVDGKADLEPISVQHTAKARAHNRRVEITLLTHKGKLSFSGSKFESFRQWMKERQ